MAHCGGMTADAADAEAMTRSIAGSPSHGIRPEHAATLVAEVLQKVPSAFAVGIRLRGPWTGGESLRVGERDHPVAWCHSVLEMREALSEHDPDAAPPLVLVTPLGDEDLGWDVLVRLAKRRLLEAGSWSLAASLFGANNIDPRLTRQRWIADMLLEHAPSDGYAPVPGGVLDADTAWQQIFGRVLGLPESRPDALSLLQWTAEIGRPATLQKLPAEAQEAVGARIGETAGELGMVLWSAIDAGNASLLVPLGLACEVLFPEAQGQTGPELTRAAVRLENFLGGSPVEPTVGRAWAAAALRVWEGTEPERRNALAVAAEELLGELRIDPFVGLSTAMPESLRVREREFAGAADAFLSGDAALHDLRAVAARLTEHRLMTGDAATERLRRLQMALRLAAFTDARKRGSPSAVNTLSEAARAYVADTSWVDLARTELLGGERDDALAAAYGRFALAVRDLRESENRTFARLLADWTRSPSAEVGLIPVERILDHVVVPTAAAGPLLVLVLDGMSFVAFRQLERQLGPRGWQVWTSPSIRQPVAALAMTPSITAVSRTSLLTGHVASGGSADEKRGFQKHVSLTSVSKSNRPPLLFHKADLSEGSAGSLSATVRDALRDADQRVVGIVMNVLDDALRSSDQLMPVWSVDRIRLLDAILYEARLAGRIIVLASDHGHILDAETDQLPGGEDERWRPHADPIAAEEVVLTGPRVEAATGESRIVVPWSERVRYVRRKTGYHGGATPQEMLAPIAVLAAWDRDMPGWSVVADAPPTWWSIEEQIDEAREEHRVTEPPKRKGRLAEVQRSLFAPSEQPTPAEASWIDELLGSTVFGAQKNMAGRMAPSNEIVRVFLDAIERGHGRARTTGLAAVLHIPEIRMRGVLAGLQRLLNVDGYPIVSVDESGDTVEVQRELLRRQFGIAGGRT